MIIIIIIIIVLIVTIVIVVDEDVFVLVEAKSLSQQLDPTVLADLYTYHEKSASAQKSLSSSVWNKQYVKRGNARE